MTGTFPGTFDTRRLFLLLVSAQAALGLYQHSVFFEEMYQTQSRLGFLGAQGAGSSLWVIIAVILLSAAWSGRRGGSGGFAAFGLAHLAALGLAHYGMGMISGRLRPGVTGALLFSSCAGALAWRMSRRFAPAASSANPALFSPGLGRWDTVSALFLLTLLIPTVFDYIHFDARDIWACRAFALEKAGSLGGVSDCRLPNYPPLFSILLWTGIGDPLFQGRLTAWLAMVLFALFLRDRLGRISPQATPSALLFFVSTVHVWQGAATYYANVPLMIFLVAGSLLALDLPRRHGKARPEEIVSGTLCLSAATLIRQDSLYYLAVVAAVVVFFRLSGRLKLALAPLLIAAGIGLTWSLRPRAWKDPFDFFATPSGDWRTVSDTVMGSALRVASTFLNGWQGQWLSHKGFGSAFYLLAGIALWRLKKRPVPSASIDISETAFFGFVSLAALVAVMACYLVIPFTGDLVRGLRPYQCDFLSCYLHLIRVGLGRMTVHLYPYFVLYGLSALAVEKA